MLTAPVAWIAQMGLLEKKDLAWIKGFCYVCLELKVPNSTFFCHSGGSIKGTDSV